MCPWQPDAYICDIVFGRDRGRTEGVGVLIDEASLQFKILIPNNSWCYEEQMFPL